MTIAPRQSKVAKLALLLAGIGAAAPLLGCGAEGDGASSLAPGIEQAQGDIIGGWTITAATRRSIGLVDVSGGCSGSLIARDWVITAAHCINWASPASNTFSIPDPNGVLEQRAATMLYPMGTSDVTLVRLGGTTPNWPNITHPVHAADPSTLVGQNIICYGRGATAYASPSGVKNSGIWKQVTKRVDHIGEHRTLVVLANNGSDIQAPGDSGGPCYFNNTLVGENWRADSVDCTNSTTSDTCKATLTKIYGTQVRSVSEFANYIEQARVGRGAASWTNLTLAGTWKPGPYDGYPPASTLVGTTVYLRGAAEGGATSTLFTLPAGHRPSATVYVPINIVGARKGRLRIQTNGVVDVYAASGFFQHASALTELDGVSFALSPTGRTAIPLQNGWTPTVYGTRGIAVNDDGSSIRFQGAISTTSTNTNMQPFVMPPGFRPSNDIYITVDLFNGAKGRAYITPAGTVTIYPEVAGTSAQGFTSFEGAFFAKSASGGSDVALYNGWYGAPYGTSVPKVRNNSGIVTFKGAIATSGTSTQAFLIPELFRPAGYIWIQADLCNGAQGGIFVQPDGWVYVVAEKNNNSAFCFTSLESVQFGI